MFHLRYSKIIQYNEKKIINSYILGDLLTPDTLRFLLPALCHLVVEDKPRKIVLNMKLHETLYTYLSYHWSIFDSFKHWLAQQVISNVRQN